MTSFIVGFILGAGLILYFFYRSKRKTSREAEEAARNYEHQLLLIEREKSKLTAELLEQKKIVSQYNAVDALSKLTPATQQTIAGVKDAAVQNILDRIKK